MVPPPSYNAREASAFSVFEKPGMVKPPSPVCRQLFGLSDQLETNRLLKEALDSEAKRFNFTWNFDVRKTSVAGNESPKPGSAVAAKPMRFEWKLQRSSEVPPFYIRPLATQRSKMSSPRPERSPLKKQRSQKAHQNTTSLLTTSAQPLGQRDENITRTTIAPSKRLCVPLFASPPKITSEAKSDLTKVPAVRLPVITLPTNKVTSPTDRVTSSDQADTPNPTKRPASRKLFNPSTPSPKRSRMARQPKITDMIPQRKLRSTTNKKLESNKTVNRSTTTIKPGQISN